jgi:hypothetical protein
MGKARKSRKRDARGGETNLGELDITLGLQSGCSSLVLWCQAIISPIHTTSHAPQAEYSLFTMSTPFLISFISIALENTYKGQRISW